MIDVEIDEAPVEPGGLALRGGREGGSFVLALYGELDIASARVLERRLGMARSSQCGRVVLDLSGLAFIDSAGLHALAQAQEDLHDAGQQLSLLRGPRAVHQVFELTDAERLFSFEG